MKNCIIHHLKAKQSLKPNLYVLHTAPTKKKNIRDHDDTHTCANTHTYIKYVTLISYFVIWFRLTLQSCSIPLASDLTDITLSCNIKCTSQVSKFSAKYFIHYTMLSAFYPFANNILLHYTIITLYYTTYYTISNIPSCTCKYFF